MNNGIKWIFLLLALAFQGVSVFASYEGIHKNFFEQSYVALIFAIAINVALVAVWHAFQKDPPKAGKNVYLAKRRSLALFTGVILLCLSGYLSSLGMYSFAGYRSGSESDSNTENSRVLQQTKDIYFQVKDSAVKKLDAETDELAKKLDAANRLAQSKSPKRRQAGAATARSIEVKIQSIGKEKTALVAEKPASDENITIKQRTAEIQTQISNIISLSGIERDQILTADDKKVLTFDAPVSRNLYDQFAADLQSGRMQAYASIGFGIAPDLMAIILLCILTPRRTLSGKIKDAKKWWAQVRHEIETPVEIPAAELFPVLVSDENERPLLAFEMPLDLEKEVSEETIRAFFPEISTTLFGKCGRNFHIPHLPNNWQASLTANEPLELVAVEI